MIPVEMYGGTGPTYPPGTGPVHVVDVRWVQNGAFRASACGRKGRITKTSRTVTCPRCKHRMLPR